MTRDHHYNSSTELNIYNPTLPVYWGLNLELFRIKSVKFALAAAPLGVFEGKQIIAEQFLPKFCLQPRLSSRSAGNVISFEGLRLSLPQFDVKPRNSE